MDTAEVEFLAEKELVSVVPNFNHATIYLIGGDVGPFRAGMPVNVPLWLGVRLRQRQRCRIIPPDWMDVTRLENVKEREQQDPFFSKMPSEFYMETAKLIIDASPEDVPRADDIRTLLKDIWDIRMAKLRSSIDQFVKSESNQAKVDHLTLLEISTIRPFLPHALDQLYRLRKNTLRSSTNSQEF